MVIAKRRPSEKEGKRIMQKMHLYDLETAEEYANRRGVDITQVPNFRDLLGQFIHQEVSHPRKWETLGPELQHKDIVKKQAF